MKKRTKGIAASAVALALAGSMIIPAAPVFAAGNGTAITQPQQNQQTGDFGQNNFGQNNFGQNGFSQNFQPGSANQNVTYASSPGTIATSTVVNTAANLVEDTENVTTFTMSDENSQVKITEAGTYIVTGTCKNGNITVKKGTTGVVLILKDLDLTSTTGATVSINKTAEAKVIIRGTVKLTDNENPDDENSTDSSVADAYDGAALKAKSGSNVYLTGDGTLVIAGNAKNGIKVGDADEGCPSFVIDGSLKINITAANDGINAGYDLTILSGTVNISVADDGIHADRILTIGSAGSSPAITVSKSTEALEGTVVNIFGGTINVTASDDGVNAANKESTYSSELDFSVNITGGTTTISAGTDGIDSNGNINITGGKVIIKKSANNGGDAGIDYDGAFYLYDTSALTNNNGVAGPDGGMGQQNQQGQMGQIGQQNQQGQIGQLNQQGQIGQQNQQGQIGQQNQQGQIGQQNQQGQMGQQGQIGQQNQQGQIGQQNQQGWQGQIPELSGQNGQTSETQDAITAPASQDQQNQSDQQNQKKDETTESQATEQQATEQQDTEASEPVVVKKTKNLKYAKLVCTYTDGKLTKVVVKAKSGAKVTVKKDGKTYNKTTLTKAGKYSIVTKKKVNGKWKKQTASFTIK